MQILEYIPKDPKAYSALISAVALCVAAWQLRANALANRARTWIDLRKLFNEFHVIHEYTTEGGEWRFGSGPINHKQVTLAYSYMGLFEHCEHMIANGLLDKKTFKEIYLWRLRNMLTCEWFVNELNNSADDWLALTRLYEKFELPIALIKADNPNHEKRESQIIKCDNESKI